MSNNPPEVIIQLTNEDAQMLLSDSESAIHQALELINIPDQRREFLEKIANLLEFKIRIKEAVESGLKS